MAAQATQLTGTVWRWILTIHRWLGIGLGLLVLIWCLSGIILMYVPYPELSSHDQLPVLEPLTENFCCPQLVSQDAVLAVDTLRLERWHATTLARVTLTTGRVLLFDAHSGNELRELPRNQMIDAGLQAGKSLGFVDPEFAATVQDDQWTVTSRFNRHRPLYKFRAREGEEWYLSGTTGELVQLTRPLERFWNWPGAVTHWLYFTDLRRDTTVWAQVVIWLTVIALFLAVTGIAVGIRHFRWRRQGASRRSPFTAWGLWHHYAGLLFGVFTLSWLFSGLMSMNPWGTLEGRDVRPDVERLRGDSSTLSGVFRELKRSMPHIPDRTVRLTSSRLGGELYFLAWNSLGSVVRFGPDGPLGELTLEDVRSLSERVNEVSDVELLHQEDAYYYNLHNQRPLPVYRTIFANGEHLYLNPSTGVVEQFVDRGRAWYRWLFNALHTGDFHAISRLRPLWDIWMVLLLSGLIAGSGTGVVLGYRYLFSNNR